MTTTMMTFRPNKHKPILSFDHESVHHCSGSGSGSVHLQTCRLSFLMVLVLFFHLKAALACFAWSVCLHAMSTMVSLSKLPLFIPMSALVGSVRTAVMVEVVSDWPNETRGDSPLSVCSRRCWHRWCQCALGQQCVGKRGKVSFVCETEVKPSVRGKRSGAECPNWRLVTVFS